MSNYGFTLRGIDPTKRPMSIPKQAGWSDCDAGLGYRAAYATWPEDWQNAYESGRVNRAHLSPFSPRPLTPTGRMKQSDYQELQANGVKRMPTEASRLDPDPALTFSPTLDRRGFPHPIPTVRNR